MRNLDVTEVLRQDVIRNLPDGTYVGRIESVTLQEKDNSMKALSCRILITHDEDLVELFYAPSYSWYKTGNMYRMLEKLGKLPQNKQPLRFAELIGQAVIITVKNNYKNGIQYSNIIDIDKSYLVNEDNNEANMFKQDSVENDVSMTLEKNNS